LQFVTVTCGAVGQLTGFLLSKYTPTHLVLDVKQQKIRKRFGRKRILLQEKLELLEALGRILFHVHERLVVQRDRVELVLGAWRHIGQRNARRVVFDDKHRTTTKTADNVNLTLPIGMV